MLFSSVYRFFLARRSYVYEYALYAMLRKAVLRVDEDSVWERFGSVLQLQQYHARFVSPPLYLKCPVNYLLTLGLFKCLERSHVIASNPSRQYLRFSSNGN
jgi:hypothetical protein